MIGILNQWSKGTSFLTSGINRQHFEPKKQRTAFWTKKMDSILIRWSKMDITLNQWTKIDITLKQWNKMDIILNEWSKRRSFKKDANLQHCEPLQQDVHHFELFGWMDSILNEFGWMNSILKPIWTSDVNGHRFELVKQMKYAFYIGCYEFFIKNLWALQKNTILNEKETHTQIKMINFYNVIGIN